MIQISEPIFRRSKISRYSPQFRKNQMSKIFCPASKSVCETRSKQGIPVADPEWKFPCQTKFRPFVNSSGINISAINVDSDAFGIRPEMPFCESFQKNLSIGTPPVFGEDSHVVDFTFSAFQIGVRNRDSERLVRVFQDRDFYSKMIR